MKKGKERINTENTENAPTRWEQAPDTESTEFSEKAEDQARNTFVAD
jgi:hypothetical protein